MVLQDASTPQEDFSSDRPPSSDVDQYGDQNPPFTSTRQPSFAPVAKDGDQQRIYVNIANLPRPFSMTGTVGHPQVLVDSIQDSCRFLTQVLQRPPKQDEADAFAFHAAKTYRIASFGSPIGMALASVQFYRTRDTMRFPGWSPFKDQEGTLSKDRLGPLRGQMARYGWHTLRLGSYWLLGSVVGAVFFGSYAVSVSLAGRATDPRLREFSEKLRQLQRDGQSVQAIRKQDTESTTQQETFEQRRQRRSVQASGRERAQAQSSYDDASPTGGAFNTELAAASDTEMMTDDQMRSHETRQRPDPRSSSTENAPNSFDMHKAAPQQPKNAQQASGSSSTGGGSAWERLRQQAGQTSGSSQSSRQSPTSSTKGEQREGSTMGDSFSFSESDEERQLARSEAQRDFDARMDREREGKDFNDDSGRGGRRW